MMKRRDFLHVGALGGAVALTGLSGCGGRSPETSSLGPSVATQPFELEEMTLSELQSGMESGRYTARSITERYLGRIDELDRKGPLLRAFIEVNPEALEIADALDKERSEKGVRGPLHGIPVAVKDNIGTADRMHTSAGSLALANSIAPKDSFVAQKLREVGAIILGKTNLSEWANFRSTRSSSGWSGRGGQTRNPYILDRSPCGSSSGSGVAASANLCAIAIGTETDGSVVCPSSANGLVGIKPTLGLISRAGIVPLAHSQDTAGTMARTVTDAAILLGALTGADPRDSATSAGRGLSDYTRFLDIDGLKGARIGVMRNYFGFHEIVDAVIGQAIEAMNDAGAEIIENANIETRGKFSDSEFDVLLYEFKADLNAYLAGLNADVSARTLEKLINFNEAHREEEMPYFGQEIFIKAQEKGSLSDNSYLDALEKNHRQSRDEGIDATLKKHRLDALIAPTGGPAWTIDVINGDHFGGGSSEPAAVAGYPNITVPAGDVFGLPIGLSFIGSAYSEPMLIKLAFAFEQATKARNIPRFLPTLAI